MSILDWISDKQTPTSQGQPDALHDELHKSIVAYGVTNRKVSSDGKSLQDSWYSAPLDTAVHYFKQTVELTGITGDFHAKSTSAPEVIAKAEFDQGVKAQVAAAHGKLGIYTHGIRTAAGEAGENAAELTADTGKPFITEDWASTKAEGLLYAAHQEKLDDKTSFKSQSMIDESVEELAKTYGAGNIDMVAHSRGSMNQVRALADLQNKKLGAVNSATFAHSDIDVSDFELAIPSFQNAAQHVNVVYNPKDNALRLSEIQRFGQVALFSNQNGLEQSSRLGRSGLTPGNPADGNSYTASAVPNYFSIARDRKNDTIGHAFAPSLVASMIANPSHFDSFSTLKNPSEVTTPDCNLSPIAGLGHIVSAVPRFALRVMSPSRVMTDLVSASPEVQKYLTSNTDSTFSTDSKFALLGGAQIGPPLIADL